MLRSCSREGHDFSHSLVETLVAAVPQEVGQVAVRHLVLVVTHLVVHSEEVVHVHLGAHFDSGDIQEEVVLLSAATMSQRLVATSGAQCQKNKVQCLKK